MRKNANDVPELVAVPGDTAEVGAGDRHACARTGVGTIYCWGNGAEGQLGAGTMPRVSEDPVQVMGIDDAQNLSVGHSHSCAVLGDRGPSLITPRFACEGRDGIASGLML